MISQQKKSGKIELNSGSPSNRPLCAWLQPSLSLKFHGYNDYAFSVYGTKLIISFHDRVHLKHL